MFPYWGSYLQFSSILSEDEVSLIEKGWTEDPYLQDKKYDQADGKIEAYKTKPDFCLPIFAWATGTTVLLSLYFTEEPCQSQMFAVKIKIFNFQA